MQNNKIRLKGQLRMYMQWPLIMSILLVLMNIWIFIANQRAGYLMALFVVLYIVIALGLYFYNRRLILQDLIEFSTQYEGVQNTLLRELSIPYVISLEDGRLIWRNDYFRKMLGDRRPEKFIDKIFDINVEDYPTDYNQDVTLAVSYQDRDYQVVIRKISFEGFSGVEDLLQIPTEKEFFFAVYFKDVTEVNHFIRENENQRIALGMIYIDNYDEVMESVEEIHQSLLAAYVDRKINDYISGQDGIIKKLEKDKYFIVLRKERYNQMKDDRFSLLKDVKTVNVGGSRPVTLSIGMGINCDTYSKCYQFARTAIDLALARGGDQAVIKDPNEIIYYGGMNEQAARNTRVRARVKAEALREFIENNDNVIVMGHKIMDADSFGASIGIYRAVVNLGRKAYIVVDSMNNSVQPLFDEVSKSPGHDKGIFVTSEEALNLVHDKTMVVVVDTSKAYLTECPELLQRCKTIAVVDHHRQGEVTIDNVVLSYIEPSASSASEMVTEILQYIYEDTKLPAVEANCLYAGIMIDTRNFLNRTGVRTFEAAAFLRRKGADITRVRKMFRDDISSYRAKAQTIRTARVYRKEFAIAECPNDIEYPTVLAAQTANELLDISGIKASFVLTVFNNRIYLSARSIDEVNVQLLCEKLGGGGHINAAGAQFNHTDVAEAQRVIRATIDEMIEDEEI